MVDENRDPLYPANCNMPSYSNHPRSMILYCELDLSYDTLVVCACSKCKGLKVNPQHVTLTHYINDRLPKVDSLISPIAINIQ